MNLNQKQEAHLVHHLLKTFKPFNMTAQEALEITNKNIQKLVPNIDDILLEIERLANEGEGCLKLSTYERNLEENEIEYLQELGYKVYYSRPLLKHAIVWKGDCPFN